MPSQYHGKLSGKIIKKALKTGASMAGLASLTSLRYSPSHQESDDWIWPEGAKSILVMALEHNPQHPSLDWWDGDRGTAGNRELLRIGKKMRSFLRVTMGVKSWDAAYYVQKSGVFLKDAAVLAGIGIIGKNNLLVTPTFGPRVRLRALFLDAPIQTNGKIKDFYPCEHCDAPCIQACPQKAFKSGAYERFLCCLEMQENEANRFVVTDPDSDRFGTVYIKYCRACELACPVGK